MKLLQALIKAGRSRLLTATGFGLISGLISAFLIAWIGSVDFSKSGISSTDWLVLMIGTVLAVVTNIASVRIIAPLATQLIYGLRRSLAQAYTEMDHASFEELGSERALITLSEDVDTTAAALNDVPSLLTNFAKVTAVTAYLLWLSVELFAVLAVFGTVALLLFLSLRRRAAALLHTHFEVRDAQYKLLVDLVKGEKELKINHSLKAHFFDVKLEPVLANFRHLSTRIRFLYEYASIIGHNAYFVFVLVILAVASLGWVTSQQLTVYVLAGLYLRGSLIALMNIYPIWMRAEKSHHRIVSHGATVETSSNPILEKGWQTDQNDLALTFDSVRFEYPQTGQDTAFALGPVTWRFAAGEITFVTGGNGSGKTTLLKLLCGLYTPDSGTISLGNYSVTAANLTRYQRELSVLFADQNLVSLRPEGVSDEEVAHVMATLGLSDSHWRDANSFQAERASLGQRNRIALAQALLAERPVVILDEWAAHQDLEYKNYFYTELLPALKAARKIVIVISHDDRYFHLANSLLKLADGRVVTQQLTYR